MDGATADGEPVGRRRLPEHTPAPGRDNGGDAVCWLERVCDACGGLPDGPPPVCERCGTPRP